MDYTAIAILERAETRGAWDSAWFAYRKEVSLQLRYLERAPLETKYTEVAARVRAVAQSREVAGRCAVIADATGVGRPVMDLLRGLDLGCRLIPATLTGGDRESASDGYYHVPKRDVITGLQALLETGALRIASRLEHGATLACISHTPSTTARDKAVSTSLRSLTALDVLFKYACAR